MSHVNRVNFGRASLQQAIRESAGGSAEVERGQSLRQDFEVIKRAFEFRAAPTDVGRTCLKRYGRSWFHHNGGFADDLIADFHFAGHDSALRLLAASAKPLLHEEEIQTAFFRLYHFWQALFLHKPLRSRTRWLERPGATARA